MGQKCSEVEDWKGSFDDSVSWDFFQWALLSCMLYLYQGNRRWLYVMNCMWVRWTSRTCAYSWKRRKRPVYSLHTVKPQHHWFLSSMSQPQTRFPYWHPPWWADVCYRQTQPDRGIFTQQRVWFPGPTQQDKKKKNYFGVFSGVFLYCHQLGWGHFWKMSNDTNTISFCLQPKSCTWTYGTETSQRNLFEEEAQACKHQCSRSGRCTTACSKCVFTNCDSSSVQLMAPSLSLSVTSHAAHVAATKYIWCSFRS